MSDHNPFDDWEMPNMYPNQEQREAATEGMAENVRILFIKLQNKGLPETLCESIALSYFQSLQSVAVSMVLAQWTRSQFGFDNDISDVGNIS